MNFAQIDELIKQARDLQDTTPAQDVPSLDLVKERLEQELEKSAEELDQASKLSVAKFLVAIDLIA